MARSNAAAGLPSPPDSRPEAVGPDAAGPGPAGPPDDLAGRGRWSGLVAATRWLGRLSDVLYKITLGLTCLQLVGTTCLTLAAVFARFVLNDSLPWSNEVSGYLLVSLTFLGIAVALRERSHISVEVIVQRGPRWLKVVSSLLVNCVAGVLGYVFLVHGIELIRLIGDQRASTFELPVSYAYYVVPFSGVLFLVFAATNVLEDILRLHEHEPEPAPEVERLDDEPAPAPPAAQNEG